MGSTDNWIVKATTFQVVPNGLQQKENWIHFFDRLEIRNIDHDKCMLIAASSTTVNEETFGALVSAKNWNLGTELTSSVKELFYQNTIHEADGTRMVTLVFMIFESVWKFIHSTGRPPAQIVMFRTMYGEDMTDAISTEVEGLRCVLKHIYGRLGAPLPRVEFVYVDEIGGLQGKIKLYHLEQPVILPDTEPMINEETGYSNATFRCIAEMEAKQLPAIVLEAYSSSLECVFNSC